MFFILGPCYSASFPIGSSVDLALAHDPASKRCAYSIWARKNSSAEFKVVRHGFHSIQKPKVFLAISYALAVWRCFIDIEGRLCDSLLTALCFDQFPLTVWNLAHPCKLRRPHRAPENRRSEQQWPSPCRRNGRKTACRAMHVPWIPSDRDDRDDQWRRDLAGTPARPRCEEFLSSCDGCDGCDGCEGLCNGEDRVPSGKRLHNYGKSPFVIGKSTINGHFQ